MTKSMNQKTSTVLASVLGMAVTAIAGFWGITGKPPITTSKPPVSSIDGTAICVTIFGVASCDQKVSGVRNRAVSEPTRLNKVCPGSNIFCSPEGK